MINKFKLFKESKGVDTKYLIKIDSVISNINDILSEYIDEGCTVNISKYFLDESLTLIIVIFSDPKVIDYDLFQNILHLDNYLIDYGFKPISSNIHNEIDINYASKFNVQTAPLSHLNHKMKEGLTTNWIKFYYQIQYNNL